jgi:hypothetical protein
MAIDQEAKNFTLSVEFAGIGLYVIHREKERATVERATVLMPTCLPTPDGRVKAEHDDKTKGARHVPYLLMNLANLGQRVPAGSVGDGPRFGVVRRLRREELFFEAEKQEEPKSIQLDPDPLPLPDLSVYKDKIRLKEGLLLDAPPEELSVRTILKGGTLAATTVGGSGKGNGSHGRDWDKSEVDWAGSIKWTRTIPGNSLTIRIHSWDTGDETPLTLTPAKRTSGEEVIELKIAILCENNPLEWKEFEPKFEKRDVDFKWLFRLFEAKDGGSLLKAIGKKEFPYPLLRPRAARTAGSTGCTGAQFGIP